ncbi:catechol 2,3-dioxygenase-like lactoylglutathione lyase family enzyme/predicted enzyme related to lactoylglutathione lyase [Paenibacillus castaneae]|uniref:VOC family protein n=1 Tax=Paenibacillus castaneae TaxID=474957 RepID=UPI000C99FB5A|nr:VOC family protein [Paenibacillus castaneae]NIK80278.1 catechol 2,3-dioxygenase-like lactoylglutathione lyase family enzyme/predicted enzyme related to lactoylglutathione lyase [Paenibacillus castaneae]
MEATTSIELSDLKAVHSLIEQQSKEELSVTTGSEGFAVTPLKYRVPLTIETQVKTDSNNIRIKFAKGMVILNWEENTQEMRWQNPALGDWLGAPNAGQVPINEWITVAWKIEENFSIVSVDGIERLRVNGDYSGVAGQVGIGTAFKAKVNIKSLNIDGETTLEGEMITPPPRFRWDGGFLFVPYDEHEKAIQWYQEHMGLTLKWPTGEYRNDPASAAEKMSSLEFPAGGLIHLKSAASEVPLKHFPIACHSESGVGFTFNSNDLYRTHQYFHASLNGVGDIHDGPDGVPRFEIEGYNGTKLVVRSEESSEPVGGRISSYGPWYVEVPDLERAIQWYEQMLEMKATRIIIPNLCVEMGGNFHLVHKTTSESRNHVDGAACPYFYTSSIHDEQDRFKLLGVDVSEVVGTGWKAMHIYDPFGNRINFWSY